MRTQTFKALLVMGAAMVLSAPAMAAEDGGHHGKHHKGEWHEKMKDMSPDERKAFMEERKAKWEALSTPEKVKMIEEKRAERRKAMDEKWDAMSDEEKVEYVENKMKRMHKKHKRHHGEKRDGKVAE